MKTVKSVLASSVVCLALFLSVPAQTTIEYTESDRAIGNPERGLFSYDDDLKGEMKKLDLQDIEAKRINNFQTVLYRQYSLLNYRNTPLDKKYLDFLFEDAAIARKAGVKMILRFSYADDDALSDDKCGNIDSSFASAAVVNQHISSLKDYFLKSKDVIALVQAGFIGNYGEWFYAHKDFGTCKNANYETRAEMLRVLLNTVPGEIPITLRTPGYKSNIIARWKDAGLPQDEISAFTRRIGFANDCFLDDATDQGTFMSDQERKYLEKETKDVPMVGEACYTAHMKNSYADWSNAKKDLENQHWTLLSAVDNGRFWTPSCFCNSPEPEKTILCTGSKCKPEDNCKNCKCKHGGKCVPFTRWNAQQFEELRQRLGYRLYLSHAKFAEEVKVNDQLKVKVSLINAGWAAPYRNRRVEVYLCKSDSGACADGEKWLGTLDQVVDIRTWYSSDSSAPIKFSFSATIPTSGLSPGTYYLYLRLPDDDRDLSSRAEFSIRLANNADGTDQNQKKRPNVFGWNVTSGANRFGSIEIK